MLTKSGVYKGFIQKLENEFDSPCHALRESPQLLIQDRCAINAMLFFFAANPSQ
jgi:hypothetical protein